MRKTPGRSIGFVVGACMVLAAGLWVGAADAVAAPSGSPAGRHADTPTHPLAHSVRDLLLAAASSSHRDTPSTRTVGSALKRLTSRDTYSPSRSTNGPARSGHISTDDSTRRTHPSGPGGVHDGANTSGRLRARAPQVLDGSCVTDGVVAPAVTIPSGDGVSYRLDGSQVAAGTHRVTPGRHEVQVVSRAGRLDRSTFSLTARAARCAGSGRNASNGVTLDASAAQVGACTSSPDDVQVQDSSTPGVDYRVTRVRTAASRTTVRVEATAQAGHRLSSANATWRVLDARHAVYTTSVSTPAGCHAQSVTTLATAAASHRSSTGSALLSAPCGVNCVGPVVPASPSFRDDTCVAATGQRSGASYVVPATRGVLYWVNGSNIPAGTYPARDGSTVTVVTSAGSGYTLSGVTQWTHTFGEAPSCSGVGSIVPGATPPSDGTTPADPSQSSQRPAAATTHTPAYTGAPTGALLTGALILLLLGSVCCLAGARRQPQRDAGVDEPVGAVRSCRSGGSQATLLRTAAARLRDRSPTDPPAGSGRTPPRPAPAVGRRRRPSGYAFPWRVALTASDP